MKKTKDIIMSLILPRRMAKYRNMHYILALFIYILGMFLALGSQYIMSEKFVADEMDRTEFNESLNVKGNPTFTKMQNIDFTTAADLSMPEDKAPQITSKVCKELFKTSDDSIIEVQIGFDENFDASEKSETTYFYDNYAEFTSNNKTILYLFTKNYVYYALDFEITLPLPDSSLFTKEEFEKEKVKFSKSVFETLNKMDRFNDALTNTQDEFENILAYIRRLKNVEKCSFVNKMNEKLNISTRVKKIETSTFKYKFEEYIDSYFATRGIYHAVLQDKIKGFKDDGTTVAKIDLTIVIDVNMDIDANHKSFTYFDYEGYMKQNRNGDVNTTYILCVYSSVRFFYVYDLCQKLSNGKYLNLDYSGQSIFEKTAAGNYKLYLPKSNDEIAYNEYGELDTTLWTREVREDDSIDFELNIDGIESSDIVPVDRHKPNLEDALYTNLSRSYQYNELKDTSFIDKSTRIRGMQLNLYMKSIVESMIAVNASSYELIYGIMAFGIFVLFPLILVLVVWLMSKKLFMKKFREYYAIGAICYVETGLIAFILGFFFSFDKFALYFMLFQAWYFIFVTFRINTDPQYNNDSDDPNENIKKKEEILDFKKVNNSNTSQIG